MTTRLTILFVLCLVQVSSLWGAPEQFRANINPHYQSIRNLGLDRSCSVVGLRMKRDVAEFKFTGTFTLSKKVLDFRPAAIFEGLLEMELKPADPIESEYLAPRTGFELFREKFTAGVFWASDGFAAEIEKTCQPVEMSQNAERIFQDHRNRLRMRVKSPKNHAEALIQSEEIQNLEAEILSDLLNSHRNPSFNAYLRSNKFKDLRFHLRPYGALPQLQGPEEVVLVNLDPSGENGQFIYSAHTLAEYLSKSASSKEDHRRVDVLHYALNTEIDREQLEIRAEIEFRALSNGDRILPFGLDQRMRVSKVFEVGRGSELDFIQEDTDNDGAFYVLMEEPLKINGEYTLRIECSGKEVLDDAGGGNYAVGSRSSWYPNLNPFQDRATYDLIFTFPKKNELVSIGNRISENVEGAHKISRWKTGGPTTVAGFNYGRFKKKETRDAETKTTIEGFATSHLPSYLRGAKEIGGMSPSRLLESGMVDAQNSIRLYHHWFGPLPQNRIAITQQPEFGFGQSWPTLIYLPLVAFFDSTQRWQLLGTFDSELSMFLLEVIPHEVAHQWWGHLVGCPSYRDQWISEGFSEFSASLYLELVEGREKYLKFWEQNRKSILEKNRHGYCANDAGPVWMGIRLTSRDNPSAYNQLAYAKGGYILHMIRWMMFEMNSGDRRFQEMMRSFVSAHFEQDASTQDFKTHLEQFLTPEMDLDNNGSMDWFFNQWVYGNEIPSYRLEYQLTPIGENKSNLSGTLIQSGVSSEFKMIVPLYLELEGRILKFAVVRLIGDSRHQFSTDIPIIPSKILVNANYDVLSHKSVSVEDGKEVGNF